MLEDRCFRLRVRRGLNPVPQKMGGAWDASDFALPTFVGESDERLVREILEGRTFTLNTPLEAVRDFEAISRGRFFRDVRPAPGLDIRAVWEAARLQHAAILLQYARLHPDDRIASAAKEHAIRQAVRWVSENPILTGPHYASPMECSLRIPILLACITEAQPGSEARRSLARAVFEHAWWIARRLSLHASLGNHTICECVGLVFAGSLFRDLPEGRSWLDTGIRLLEQEATHQILDDGGPAEQSLNYHRFILDLYWLAGDFLGKNRLHDFRAVRPRLVKGEEFLRAFDDGSGQLPAIGDSDDGHAVGPGLHPKRDVPDISVRRCRTFPDSGYTVLHLENGLFVTFDHGPLGMPPLYNHGHADALSLTLSRYGKKIFVDPGTYRYNGAPEFRRYFKGTRAHNTVTIDGADQAVQETSFIWSRPYRPRLIHADEADDAIYLDAVSNGYERLEYPVMHRRALVVLGKSDLLIADAFSGKGSHRYELNYHLHPDTTFERIHEWWVIRNEEACVFMTVTGHDACEIHKGELNPPFGWFSPAYGAKTECVVLSFVATGEAWKVSFRTLITTEPPVGISGQVELN